MMSILNSIIIPLFKYNPQIYENFSEKNKELISSFLNSYGVRFAGIFGHPNKTGNFSTIAFMAAFYVFFDDVDKKWLLASILSIIATAITLLLTGSRTAIVSSAIFAFAYICLSFVLKIYKENKVIKTKLIFVIFLGVCLITVLLLVLTFNDSYRHTFFNQIIRVSSISDGSGRDKIWQKSIPLGLTHPFIGISQIKLSNIIGMDSHNTYIQIFATSGIPCFILFIIYIVYSLYSGFRNIFESYKNNTNLLLSIFLLSSLLGILLENCFERMMFCLFFTPGFFGYYIVNANIQLASNNKKITSLGITD